MVEISKTMTLEMGHRLPNHQGACHSLHGHSYRIEIFVSGALHTQGPSDGMVVDFAVLKRCMLDIDAVFDHKMCLSNSDPLLAMFLGDSFNKQDIDIVLITELFVSKVGLHKQKFVIIEGPPTAEVLAHVWMELVANVLDCEEYKLSRIKVWETASSCVEVYAENEL